MAPKLKKHSTSYIFLPLFSSLHIHYTISGRKCQEKKGRFLQKNYNKSLDFGSKLCYNGSVYPERNENHSHLDGFLGRKHPANLGHRLRFALFWGNVPLSCVCLGWLLGIGNRTPLGHLFVLRYNPMISRPVVDTRDLNQPCLQMCVLLGECAKKYCEKSSQTIFFSGASVSFFVIGGKLISL